MESKRSRGSIPDVPNATWWIRLWEPFWAVPVAFLVGAIGLGIGVPELERAIDHRFAFFFSGGPDGARSLLGTIASAMISVTGLVFSITIVALQLASSQFTPRVLAGFLGDRITQVTLGMFTATFVYALTVMRSVRGSAATTGAYVPQISVTIAYVFVLASVGMFLAFIHTITKSMQVSQVVSRIGDHARLLAGRMYPEPDEAFRGGPSWSPSPGTPRVRLAATNRHGHLALIDFVRLARAASAAGVVITLDRSVGTFLAAEEPFGWIWGREEVEDKDLNAIMEAFALRGKRSDLQDVAFSVRQLVDIAERALSPGVNDPTTATHVIDELHVILRLVAARPAISPYVCDGDEQVRVVHIPPNFGDLLQLAVEEIAYWGKDAIQVPRHLYRMLDDLAEVARPEHASHIDTARAFIAELSSNIGWSEGNEEPASASS